MVKLQCLFILILLSQLSHNICSELLNEESKKIVVHSKDQLYDKGDFQCDLTLLPQQKKLMYFGARSDASADVSYDLYRWPKNKDGFVIIPYSIPKSSKYCKLSRANFQLKLSQAIILNVVLFPQHSIT